MQLRGVSEIVSSDGSRQIIDQPMPRVGIALSQDNQGSEISIPDPTSLLPVELIADLPGRIESRISNNDQNLSGSVLPSGVLTTTEAWHNAWVARVDGQIVPTVRVNGFGVGCRVPSGAKIVEFRFEAASHRLGRTVGFCALGLLCLSGVFVYRSRRDPA